MNDRIPALRVDIASLEKYAQRLRLQVAKRLAQNDDIIWKRQATHSHYDHYSEHLVLPSGDRGLRFNDLVTETVLREHVLTESDPFLVTFLGAKVVEQNFYQFFDPAQPSRPIKNLSISKHYGTFFTPPDIAELMTEGLARLQSNKTLVDPCAGSGVLLCASLVFSESNTYEKLIGVELDGQLAKWGSEILKRVAVLTGYSGVIEYHADDGLDFLLAKMDSNQEKFDIIINPPYGRIRITSDRLSNNETSLHLNESTKEASFARLQGTLAQYSGKLKTTYPIFADERGILEYSRIFFRACAEHAREGSAVSIITPDSWMAGSDGAPLRSTLLRSKLIDRIVLISEDSKKFATVNQATAITFASNQYRAFIKLDKFSSKHDSHAISYDELNASPTCAIPKVSGIELKLFKKLSSQPNFKTIPWLINVRGELDQTAQKHMFSNEKTSIRLVRGEHVERFSFKHTSSPEKPSYVLEEHFREYIAKKPKAAHLSSPRIVGRQCSYAQQARRLIFCRVPAGVTVGNSCNYLHFAVESEQEAAHRATILLGLLNSRIFDWFFRIENSNNHVANYEIDAFPAPSSDQWLPLISAVTRLIEEAVQESKTARLSWLCDLLDAAVSLSYNLDPETELRSILEKYEDCDIERTVNYSVHLKRGVKIPIPSLGQKFFNNEEPTLSALDRLIILHVPEGGNWQDIPESVPSERLAQIRAMSAERGVVRTTYYGRLRRNQPAYTMNTYFNRPGNGTHIHPVMDRTLTSREAARLQSFPDSYIFTGSEGAIRDQIGNAVPPLLAAAIGQKFLPISGHGVAMDLFCGAGGLSYGLEAAGWHVLAAVDHNQYALDTYCLNRPCDIEPQVPANNRTAVYRRDLHEAAAFEDICSRVEQALGSETLDLLVGGPPCQGFSHAGFRLHNDARNDLASIYLHFAERLRPKTFILENVEGLATYKGGKVLKDICDTLTSMGYRVENPVWKLCAEQYGVPQMRRRVFVVAALDSGADLSPPEPTHERCPGRRSATTYPSLFDVKLAQPLTVAEAFAELSMPTFDKSSKLLDWYDQASSSLSEK